MSRILVPVDFTRASMAALHYAWHFAAETNSEMTLIHIVQAGFTTADPMLLDTLDAAMKSAGERMQNFLKEYEVAYGKVEGGVMPLQDVRFGIPGFAIADVANDLSFDYVVTGMRDHHSFVDKMLGTTSAIIVRNCSCPVILIHEKTRWVKPEKIIFTIDHETDFDESVLDFCKFNLHFNAPTDFIHVKESDEADFVGKDALLHELFLKNPPDFAFTVKSITGGDIVQTIVDYTIFEKADLIVMVHRKRGFLDSVFKRSLSLTTAEGLHLPVMILSETAPES
jgi:nucleotide-binding universal stress UspA family protein